MSSKLRVWLILGVTCALATGVAKNVWPVRVAPPAEAARAAQPAPRVYVTHSLVETTEEVVERRPVRRERAGIRPRPGASAPPLISRVKRVLFGSGRYRPEPFPRASMQDSPAP